MLINERKLLLVLRLIVLNMFLFIKFGGLYVLFLLNEIWVSVMFLIWLFKGKKWYIVCENDCLKKL